MSIKPNTTPCTTCGTIIDGYRTENPEGRYYCGWDCYQANRKNFKKKKRSDAGRWADRWTSQPCEHCGETVEFLKSDLKNHERRFCNVDHQLAWFSVNGNLYRERDEFGRMKGRPDGSTFLTNNGYIMQKTPTGWRQQHRVVMEEILGRPLTQMENVHHMNGIRTDNRPDNLELWAVMQPTGQRVQDLVAHAWATIENYDPEREYDPRNEDLDV